MDPWYATALRAVQPSARLTRSARGAGERSPEPQPLP